MQLKNIIKLYIDHKAWTSSTTQNDTPANTHCCSVLAFDVLKKRKQKFLQAGNENKIMVNNLLKGLLKCLITVKCSQSKFFRKAQCVSYQTYQNASHEPMGYEISQWDRL